MHNQQAVWQPVRANPTKRRAYIKKLCRRIAETFKPEKIILFGSQAWGKPRPDSDVDLLVVMPFEGSYFDQAHQIRMRLTLEWSEKAEEDRDVMLKAYRARKNPAYNATCFHAQQCAEKYLKGRLEEAHIAFAKTHDLDELLQQAKAVEPAWSTLQADLDYLNDFSVLYRYPASKASKSLRAHLWR